MTKNNDKVPGGSNLKIEYLGFWGILFVWVKVFALTAIMVLIAKYIFKVPLAF